MSAYENVRGGNGGHKDSYEENKGPSGKPSNPPSKSGHIKGHINGGVMGGKGGHYDGANKMASSPRPNTRDTTDNRFGSNSTTTNDELDDQWSIVL